MVTEAGKSEGLENSIWVGVQPPRFFFTFSSCSQHFASEENEGWKRSWGVEDACCEGRTDI